jgi:hypothetical protein
MAILSDRLNPFSGLSSVSTFVAVVGIVPVAMVRVPVPVSVSVLVLVPMMMPVLGLVLVLVLETRREVVVDRYAQVSAVVQYVPS